MAKHDPETFQVLRRAILCQTSQRHDWWQRYRRQVRDDVCSTSEGVCRVAATVAVNIT